MNIVMIMDGVDTIVAETDTTLGLMLAAQERGHLAWHCRIPDVSLVGGAVRATAHPISADDAVEPPVTLGDARDLDLRDVGAVLVRTDPPFDAAYLHLTLLLDHLDRTTVVVNSPSGLRAANEKLYATHFRDVTPMTIVTADADRLMAFAVAQGGAVLKPIDGHGGRGVMAVRPGDDNAASIIDTLTKRSTVAVVAQRFLDGVRDGDKRILLLDGEPLGALLRRPTEADFRANICVGGTVEAVDLDDADRRVIGRLAPSLRAEGLHFVGLDVIDGQLTEVNVTSPTGLRQMVRMTGTRPDLDVITWLERHAI